MMRFLTDVIANVFRKPCTIEYPKKDSIPDRNYRGIIQPLRGKCTACGTCVKYCPSGAITLHQKEKYIEIDMGKCMQCGLCVSLCPVKAITTKDKYLKPTKRKSDLIVK